MKNPPRILVTNDDGVRARGLQHAIAIAHAVSDDVHIVAPADEQSGAAHSLSLTKPIRYRQMDANKYAVDGTPTDCVLLAFSRLITNPKPDIVISGVNRGQNLADDLTYSGTVAGAMEGSLLGAHASFAFSQAIFHPREPNWECAHHFGPNIVKTISALPHTPGVLYNVNFPDAPPNDVQGIQITSQGKRDKSLVKLIQRNDPRNQPYFWIGFNRHPSNPPKGVDLHAVYNNSVSITPLHTNLTDNPSLQRLNTAFKIK